mmetsp:Transcript_70193/g.203524  ORF Transcript_70193/g.203524 Transcript_70193/m.203524 type:complete len:200 (+) Transcript_70193:935-1534(+)
MSCWSASFWWPIISVYRRSRRGARCCWQACECLFSSSSSEMTSGVASPLGHFIQAKTSARLMGGSIAASPRSSPGTLPKRTSFGLLGGRGAGGGVAAAPTPKARPREEPWEPSGSASCERESSPSTSMRVRFFDISSIERLLRGESFCSLSMEFLSRGGNRKLKSMGLMPPFDAASDHAAHKLPLPPSAPPAPLPPWAR